MDFNSFFSLPFSIVFSLQFFKDYIGWLLLFKANGFKLQRLGVLFFIIMKLGFVI